MAQTSAHPRPTHPSLTRPTMFAITWQACTWVGWGLVAWAVLGLSPDDFEAMGAPLAMVVAVVLLSELRPIVMSRLDGNPVSISLAFVFAVMYVWGLPPALLLYAGAVILSEVLQRKPLWKVLFNVGQYSISVTAAWLVIVAFGDVGTPLAPHVDLAVSDLGWIVGSWAVYHLVNLGLVAGLASTDDETWWDSFSEEFWFYTASAAAVLALSPLIAIVLVSGPYAWTLLPLLLLPLLAVQRAAQMSREKEHQALHDPLTGLPNRALLADRIGQSLARGVRLTGRVTVLFLDVDLFKVVNDSLGHAAGDSLLIELTRRLSAVVRPGDTLARFGGDEFVIVCDDVRGEDVDGLAERVADVLREPFEFEGRPVTVTASIGIAIAAGSTDAETLLRDADAAMYRAKAGGRNRAVVFDEAMHDQAAARLDVENGLRSALERGELRVVYQPVVDIRDGSPVGFEALVRWEHPQLGLLTPDRFVPVAEETGLIIPLGTWVIEQATAQAAQWRREVAGAEDLWIAVNLSARQLLSPDLISVIALALAATGLPASHIRLEITESVLMDDVDRMVEAMLGIRSLGVQLAIDDFGTGYSSLSYLKSLPVSTIKIDHSFVEDLGGGDPSARPLVEAIIGMARALGMTVIAEGVETEAQLRTLQRLGAGLAQGYLWSRPMQPADVPAWISARATAASPHA